MHTHAPRTGLVNITVNQFNTINDTCEERGWEGVDEEGVGYFHVKHYTCYFKNYY